MSKTDYWKRRARRLTATVFDVAILCIFALWAYGHFLGHSVSNRWVRALYLIPAPAAFFSGIAWFIVRGRRAPVAMRWLLSTFLFVSGWIFLGVDMAWHCRMSPVEEEALRVVHWNLARPRADNESVWAALREEQAAIYVLAERPLGPVEKDARRLDLASGYGVAWGELSVVSRYPLEVLERRYTGVGSMLGLRVMSEDGELVLIAVDAYSHPLLNPQPLVRAIVECAEEYGDGLPVIVIGDFNTLRGSPLLAELRECFDNAYETAGCGWPYTWPTPIPLFSIDHTWVNERVEIQRYRLRGGRLSDHARQVLDVRLPAVYERPAGGS